MTMLARVAGAATAALLLVALAGCAEELPRFDTEQSDSADGSESDSDSGDGLEVDGGAAEAAVQLIQTRYELVRDGDFEGACALYSDLFAEQYAEIAQVPGAPCVEAHEEAAASSAKYIADSAALGAPGKTPYFYVPEAIEIVPSALTAYSDTLVYVGPGAVVSLDTTEFEDGPGKIPGWLEAIDLVQRDESGAWRFIVTTEQ